MSGIDRLLLGAALAVGSLFLAASAQAQLTTADIGKNLEFVQTGPATVAPIGAANAFFYARTFYTNPNDFDGGDVQVPGALDYAYNSPAIDCCGGLGGAYQTSYITPAALEASYPDSASPYVLTATNSVTGDAQQVSIVMSSDALGSLATPAFTAATYDALQGASAGFGPSVYFNAFSAPPGSTAETFLSVYNLTAGTFYGGFFGPGPLTDSFDLSAVPFTAGDNYELQLIFDSAANSSSDVYDLTSLSDVGGIPTAARSDLRTDLYFSIPAGVPEPGSWAMLILGLGAVGVVLRRPRMAVAQTC